MTEKHLRPDDLSGIRSVYFIGIGGISMSALAEIMLSRNLRVCGYDRSPSGVTERLESLGIRIRYGDDHRAEDFKDVDLVCYTAAVDSSHPQMKLASEAGLRIVPRAELLGCIAESYPVSIGVAGTHGKSTTSGMLSHMFLNAESKDPTFIVGAVVTDVGSTFRIGRGEECIYEACEYKDSFLSFYPGIAVVLNIEMDHTDYFKSMEQLIGSFRTYLSHTGPEGTAVLNADNANCLSAGADYEGRIVTFGVGNTSADYYASNLCMDNGYGVFDVMHDGKKFCSVRLRIPGIHNVSNALAACAAAHIAGLTADEIREGLETYYGVRRRFEPLGTFNGALFYDDYAHHPDEIRATLAAAKGIAKGRVICAFQPHNYSRLRDLFNDFGSAFSDADKLILTKLYAPRETALEDYTSEKLAKLIGAEYVELLDDITPRLLNEAREGDVVLYMGAGNIEKEAERFRKMQKPLDK